LTTLYIRLPSRASVEHKEDLQILPCRFALLSDRGEIEAGVASLDKLSELLRRARRTVLLVAASDVTLLQVKTPPMSGARLRAALPNLVEEQLITDPSECALAAGPESAGQRVVAVTQRAWLSGWVRAAQGAGARHLQALPLQSCLPWQEQFTQAVVIEHEHGQELVLQPAARQPLGLALALQTPAQTAGQVFDTLAALAPQGEIVLRVPAPQLESWRTALSEQAALAERTQLQADEWQQWLGAAQQPLPAQLPDFVPALGLVNQARSFPWRSWRWPLALAALLLGLNIVALNYDWWRLQGEARNLRAAMLQMYRSAFPKETVIIDPLAQMRQKIDGARRASGEAAADDFTVLLSRFAEVWNAQGKRFVLAGLDYRERSLLVRMAPGAALPALEQLQPLFASRGLELRGLPAEGGMTVWQLRSMQ